MEHIPVLLNEVIKFLQPKKDGKYIDCTLGFGGHGKAILSASDPNGKLLGIEGDEETFKLTKEALREYKDRAKVALANFRDIKEVAHKNDFDQVDAILYDLGISSYQLDQGKSGLSFQIDAPLDMRMRPWEQNLMAAEIVNTWQEDRLANLIYEYGGERASRKIAKAIKEARRNKRIISTFELAELIEKSIGRYSRIHPATKTFQALRIKVNEEYENLEISLENASCLLKDGGRIAVISFHEGEDRIVKNFFKNSDLKIITKKPIIPSREEVIKNPRSRSAKLRIAEK
ncbi:MAG: 16S rRNA (cytosine(1402)-N(4))-methyltransferase RsmH [Patescibacteria group bacterium]|jgi:16S rRNA (cytosine1402-N4)-methyltransferase